MNNSKTKKPGQMKKTIKTLCGYLGKNRLALLAVIIFIGISSFAMVAGSYFLKPLINNYILPGDFSGLAKMLVLMGAIYGAGAFSSYAYSRIMVHVAQNTINEIRKDLFNHMQKLPISYFDNHTHGDLMSFYTNDIDQMNEALNNSVTNILSSSITFIGMIIMMIVLSPILSIITFISLAVMFFVIKTVGSKSKYYFGKQQQHIGELNGFIEEMIEGQKVVKVFCHEDKVVEEFKVHNKALQEASTNAQNFAGLMMPLLGNLSHINYSITCCVGGLITIMGMFDVGSLISFLQYTRQVAQPIAQVSQQVNMILAALAGAERIFAVLEEEVEIDNGTVTLTKKDDAYVWEVSTEGKKEERRLCGDVNLENVVFGYTEAKTILKGISLKAKAGQKVAFVGSTGAGKTTITNLINRFYEINSGRITYDGINITDIQKDDLRKSIGVVLQDTHLFTGTIADNIRYGNLEATEEEVIAAAKLANAHTFIKNLPDGYNTVLTGDGEGLSQGQRQLLAIARAAVANPSVLIMDEATSSIDTRTEKLIAEGMDKLMEGRTVFVIAHRLSTIRNSDAIMVLERGEIIERGNHEELLEKKGKYYQLYTGKIELA